MAKTQWTQAQLNAIESRGGTLLVSAAAGSGKTAVLVERVIRMLLDEKNPVDVDKLLIVTFTNAAAAEMRERISTAISQKLLVSPDNYHLKRQQVLLPSAKICTIDTFCIDLVRENFQNIGISQNFSIIDDGEYQILSEKALDTVINDYYENHDEAFFNLVEALSNARDDSEVRAKIKKLDTYINAHPFPLKWLDDVCSVYESEFDVDNNIFKDLLVEYLTAFVDDACMKLSEICEECLLLNENARDKLLPFIQLEKEKYADLLSNKQWSVLYEKTQNFDFARWPSIKEKNEETEFYKKVRDSLKKSFKEKVAPKFAFTCDEFKEDIIKTSPLVKTLAEATARYYNELMRLKKEKDSFTFSDIEHFALNLLVDLRDEQYVVTPLAEHLKNSYHEILIDEYQDTNKAQDLLFTTLSNGKNMFMVGDVKQSIYRFRQAMPQIFMGKKDSFYEYDGESYPAQVILDKNFRSHENVCDFINFVFKILFSRYVGELEYSKNEFLNAQASYEKINSSNVSLRVIDYTASGSDDKIKAEAEYIASLIDKKVRGGELITAKEGGTRKISYGDIAVLFRSVKKFSSAFIEAFKKYNIPVAVQNDEDFFSSPEISTVISLLKVVDNPMQDVPLLSIMMSPIFAFTPDELAAIRIADRKVSLYTSLLNYAKKSDESKVNDFLNVISRFRTYASTMSISSFVRKIYDETSYIAVAFSMGDAEQRVANLNCFVEYAQSYERNPSASFSAFVRYIETIQSGKGNLKAASIPKGEGKCVKLMTIHNSKGLEFPVCILAGTSSQYNYMDLNDQVILNPFYGVSMKLYDEDYMVRYRTAAYEAMKIAEKRALMSENLRVLYVAMTRAREQLIITSCVENAQSFIQSAAKCVQGGCITPYTVLETNNDAKLIFACAMLHNNGNILRKEAGLSIKPIASAGKIEVLIENKSFDESEDKDENNMSVPVDESLLGEIEKRLSFDYKYKKLANLAAKRTASSLDEQGESFDYFAAAKPSFMDEKGLNAAEKGTAFHAFMQHCDFSDEKNDVSAQADTMLKNGLLTKIQRECLDMNMLRIFFESELAQRIRKSNHVEREFKFSTFVDASTVYPDVHFENDEKVYVQGMVDLMFVEDGKIVVIDYKTDKVNDEDQLLDRYKNQQKTYCDALQKIFSMPVKECGLYSFRLGKELLYKFI